MDSESTQETSGSRKEGYLNATENTFDQPEFASIVTEVQSELNEQLGKGQLSMLAGKAEEHGIDPKTEAVRMAIGLMSKGTIKVFSEKPGKFKLNNEVTSTYTRMEKTQDSDLHAAYFDQLWKSGLNATFAEAKILDEPTAYLVVSLLSRKLAALPQWWQYVSKLQSATMYQLDGAPKAANQKYLEKSPEPRFNTWRQIATLDTRTYGIDEVFPPTGYQTKPHAQPGASEVRKNFSQQENID
jgi:hypothetical protein